MNCELPGADRGARRRRTCPYCQHRRRSRGTLAFIGAEARPCSGAGGCMLRLRPLILCMVAGARVEQQVLATCSSCREITRWFSYIRSFLFIFFETLYCIHSWRQAGELRVCLITRLPVVVPCGWPTGRKARMDLSNLQPACPA
jgi:hypothetical protein